MDIVLPDDVVVAAERNADTWHAVVDATAIPPNLMALDIGPRTAGTFAAAIGAAKTAFWNGPMGVFELAPFAKGTLAVAHALASDTVFSVVGGGDTAAALRELGFADSDFGFVSTGGGASQPGRGLSAPAGAVPPGTQAGICSCRHMLMPKA